MTMIKSTTYIILAIFVLICASIAFLVSVGVLSLVVFHRQRTLLSCLTCMLTTCLVIYVRIFRLLPIGGVMDVLIYCMFHS
ncbi:unnamed protein product [Adineta ricciae]|uniref:Uncharacterized protein n=1 Tax=Adineta ricciae TaxID=249248 RepID=A0A815UIV1_ADIRI|nr:unnamed protein product [Adineta ricciae]